MARYSLYSSPYGRALEEKESKELEGEKAQTDCKVEHEGLGSNPLQILAFVWAVENSRETEIDTVAACVAATGHVDEHCLNVGRAAQCKGATTVVTDGGCATQTPC